MRDNYWRRLIIFCIDIVILCQVRSHAHLVWVNKPQNRAVALGHDVILHCQAKLAGANDTTATLSYTWKLNGGNLTIKSSRFYNNSLFISMVSLNELGNYSCVVTSHRKIGNDQTSFEVETLTATALVIKAYINDFIIDPESLEGSLGEDAVLTCITGRSAPSLQVQWLRNGEVFIDGETLTVSFGDYDTTGLSVQLSMKLIFTFSSETVGWFQCVAYNDALKMELLSGQANVTIKINSSDDAPLIEWNLPQSLIIAEGQDLILPCKVMETAELRVFWYLGPYRIDQSRQLYISSNNSLVFLPVGHRDSGNYSCVAQNSKGTTQSPYIELVVAFLGLGFRINPSDASAIRGQDIVLKCNPPESIPAATVTWYKDYLPIDLQSNRVKVIENYLYLTSVIKNDSGIYYCVAFNNLTVPSSRTSEIARVRVEGPPIMIQPPLNIKVIKGKLLHLACLVDSDPTPVTTWQFEDMPLPPSSKVSFLNRGQELWITNVGKEWEGRYTCLSRNKYGSASADAQVIVLVAPVSLKPIGDLTAMSDESILIPCMVVCDPMPSIQWFFNGLRVSVEGSVAAVHNLSWTYRFPNLYIEHVYLQHAGKYVCVGSNDVGNASSFGSLVVHAPPVIMQAPTDITAVIGSSTNLSCLAEGNPDPTLHWLYNSSTLLPGNVQVKDNNRTLMILSVSWNSVGSYTCVAQNLAGTVQATSAVKLMIPPKIEEVHFPQTPVRLQTRFNLSCVASGLPTPLVQWARFNTSIHASLNGRIHMPKMGMLVVEVAWKNDSGQYECWASSNAGQQKNVVSIVVYGEPSPPMLLRALPLSSESVYLIWEWLHDGETDEKVDKFEISFREKTSKVASIYAVTPLKNETRTEVVGLQPATEYMFSVSAVNDAGTGPASNIMSAITLQSNPSPPVNLQISSLTSTSVTLTWEVPTSPNGVVRMYELRYKRVTETHNAYLYLNITDPQFPSNDMLLSPLLPYSDYDAQVRACNIDRGQNLWGNYSSITFQTLASKPSLPPQNIKVDAVDQFSLRVTWQQIPELAKNGPVLFYRVIVNYNETQLLGNVKVNASITSYTIRGLFPWRYYSVVLAGGNEAGLGPVSGPHGAMTLPLAPVASPGHFQVSADSASSLKLSWQALQGDLFTCNITSYVVEYKKQDSSAWERLSVPSSLFSYVLEPLLPWTWYECQVAAFCQTMISGMGPFTDIVPIRTLQGVSSPVTLLSYTVNTTYIVLSWQPPKNVKGILIGYRVVYEALDSANVSDVLEINATSQMAILQDLHPQTVYNISVAAVNAAGYGQELILRVTTLLLPPTTYLPTTSELMISTNSSNSTEHFLSQSNNSDISKHLASIVAGSIVGAIALIIMTVFICIKCMKYRQKQRLNYEYHAYFNAGYTTQVPLEKDVDSETVGVEGTSYRHLEPSSDIATISSNISFQVTDSQSSTTVTQSTHTSHSALDNQTGTGENLDNTSSVPATNVKEEKKRYSIPRPSLPILLQTSPYSMLQEDNSFSNDDFKGFDNPGFIADVVDPADDVPTEVNLRHHNSGQHLSVVKYDTESVSSETLRRNRMHNENAAAIAVLRNSQTIFPDDTDTLMDLESIGSEVIFNERTVL